MFNSAATLDTPIEFYWVNMLTYSNVTYVLPLKEECHSYQPFTSLSDLPSPLQIGFLNSVAIKTQG